MTSSRDLSIIIPVSRNEMEWKSLVSILNSFEIESEVILISPEKRPSDQDPNSGIKWIESALGRAQQMNAGARAATRRFLWFLHADSIMEMKSTVGLLKALSNDTRSLYYFDLRFSLGGSKKMKINEWGAWWRSHFLGMPFGDQGFCLERTLFWELGGYREDLEYGEDHIFVWKARRAGVRIRCVGHSLWTSPRKYERRWARTTIEHLYKTYAQALPEFLKGVQGQFRREK